MIVDKQTCADRVLVDAFLNERRTQRRIVRARRDVADVHRGQLRGLALRPASDGRPAGIEFRRADDIEHGIGGREDDARDGGRVALAACNTCS